MADKQPSVIAGDGFPLDEVPKRHKIRQDGSKLLGRFCVLFVQGPSLYMDRNFGSFLMRLVLSRGNLLYRGPSYLG